MIVVRNTFQLKFGMAKEAKSLIKSGLEIAAKSGVENTRVCLDVTGPFYTLVLEITFDSLSAYDKAHAKMGKDKAWQKWYTEFSELLESGRRDIYTIVE